MLRYERTRYDGRSRVLIECESGQRLGSEDLKENERRVWGAAQLGEGVERMAPREHGCELQLAPRRSSTSAGASPPPDESVRHGLRQCEHVVRELARHAIRLAPATLQDSPRQWLSPWSIATTLHYRALRTRQVGNRHREWLRVC
jgi:hypothetical protein